MLKSGFRNMLSRITYPKFIVVETLQVLLPYNDTNCRGSHRVKAAADKAICFPMERKPGCVCVCVHATLKFKTGLMEARQVLSN